ncbi:hypothetical protein [Parabacteroides goldsteinii]|uniref:hypothetical protein n=1 Tax=Parabacteroides goldsteinii TaxID=328812 RepID=UPI00206C7259|nr:MAG TPA: tail protein [Caudoviricetes sp.]
MKDKLFIDNVEVDLPEGGSGVVLNRAVSKPADMSTILSGYSYTIQLPKTAHNIQTFGFSTEVNVESDYPHVEHTAKVIRDGITLFDDGVAVVKSASKTIEVLIKFGGNKRLTSLNDYKLKDIFPDSGLIPWDYSVTETDFVKWVPKLDGMQRQHPEHLRPAIKVSTLFDMIVGQSFVMNNAYRSVIEKMWLMLPTTNGSEDVAKNLAFRLKGTTTSDLISGRERYDILPDLSYQNAPYHQKLHDLIYRTLPVTFIKIPLGGRYRIKGTVKANNAATGWKFGIFSPSVEFKEGEPPMFDIFESASKDIDEYRNIGAGDICFGIYDPFRTGNYEIDLTISFAPENEKDYSQTAFLLDYPIRENLPDISTMDFVKSVMGVFGLMVEQQGSVLSFYNVDDVILNKSGAINISKMLIDKKDDKLEYSYGLTKKNMLKYAEDDLVDKSFGAYTFTADTYDKLENTVYQSPYAATEKNIPLYTYKVEEGKAEYTLNKTSKCRLLLENGTVALEVWGKWIDADMKTVTFRSFTFEPLKYDNLVRRYWTGYLGVYANKPRISYRKAKLDPTFFPNLSFCKPLYADGNYYMLLSVNNYTEVGKADLELALIDGVDVTGEGETSLKNTILVNPTTPLKFTSTAVALYTAAAFSLSVATAEGKLIRELDEIGSLGVNSWIAVDTEDGDAKKFNLQSFHKDIDGMYLRKDIPDTAHGAISFEDMAQSTLFAEGYEWGAGWGINNDGLGWFGELKVRDNVYIGKMSGSPSSASGMMGYGTILDMQKASGEFDYLLARKEFRVNTMVVNETLGLNGNRFVSDFNKIESVQELSDRYRCKIDKIEGMMYMNIRGDDLICCQQFSGLSSHYYYGEVFGITEDYFDLRKPLLDGHSVPMAGDTVFRAGNDSDPNRQGVIYLATSDTNAPYIDVLDGLTSPDMTDKTKVRIGNVSGITSKYKGNLGQLGYHHGIYIKGGIFEECDIYLEDGTTVYQSFQIINGKLESEISSIRDAINDNGNNILSNPTWTAGLDKWDYTQDINLFSATNGWLWFNAAFYSDKKSSVEVIRDSASRVLRMYKSGITQVNGNLQSRESGTYVMRIRYKAITAGTLTYGFSGKELYKSTLVTATTEYQEETITAEWDGTGDFSCTYSGDIYIKSLTVISDRIAAIRNEFETKIEQTDQKIELLATRVTTTEEGVTQAQASISVMADEIALKATKDEFNALGRRVTANEASITVNADAIKLKVSQIDFDSLGRRVTSAESSIETNAYQISLKASQYSVSSLTGRVLSAESAIQVNADNISSKVAVTDYTGTNIVSMINQTADAVKIMASKVDIQAYNLNMIRNSGECQNTVYWQVDGGASNLSVSNGSISVNFSNISGRLYNRSLAGIQLLVRRKYTLRISLYSSVSTTVTVWIGPYQTDIPVSVGDREYTYTFTVSSNTDAQFFCMACSTSCRMMVHRIKFEDGEYATPWTPNPNDSIYSLDSDLVAALNGTTISGGLQLTTKIKLGLLSGGVWTEQGGISANIDNIMLWAGGTYDQAKAGNVKTILRHDGSLKAEGEFECGSKTGNRCLLSGDGRFRMFRGQVEILNLGYFVESDTYYYPSLSMTRKTSSGTAFGGVTLSPTELLFSSPDGLGCLYGNNNMIFNINKFPTSGSMVGAVYRDGNTLKIRTS